MQYPDGTWIETDSELTTVISTWFWNAPRPAGVCFLWRRKQLLDQIEYLEHLQTQGVGA